MSDPIAIPAGVVGMVSLGIQLSQTLYKYCTNVLEQTRDIQIVSEHIKALESTFNSLNSVIRRIKSLPQANGEIIVSLNQSVAACQSGLDELQEFVSSVVDLRGDGLRGKTMASGRNLRLAFVVGSCPSCSTRYIRSLRLSDLQSRDLTCKSALRTVAPSFLIQPSELSMSSFDAVAGMSEATTSRLSKFETDLLAAISTAQRDTALGIYHASGTLERRLDSMEQLFCTQYERMRDHLLTIADGNGSLLQSTSRLLAKPDALREACDIVRQASLQASGSRELRRRDLLSTHCDCDLAERVRSSTERKVRRGPVVLLNEYYEASRHYKDCAVYKMTRAQRRFSAQFRAGIWPRLPMLVRASLACTRGAGGFSISPQLSFCVAAEHSCARYYIESVIAIAATPPTFKTPEGCLAKDDVVLERMDKSMKVMQEEFAAGATSPTARAPDGSSLLHTCRKQWPLAEGERQNKIISKIIELIKMLVLAGSPADEIDMNQATPLDMLMDVEWPGSCLYTPEEVIPRLRLAETVASLADDIPVIRADYGSPFNVLQFAMNSSILIEDLGLPPLPAAILNRSESQVRAVLAKYPKSATETIYGLTPLHLSSRWPTGLTILLNTEARRFINDLCVSEASAAAKKPCKKAGHRATPLDFALCFHCEKAAQLLLEAGATWNKFRLEEPSSPGCVRVVAGYLAMRRKQLFHLASDVLSPNDLIPVCPEPALVDTCAAAIVRRLRQIGVAVPDHLAVPDDYEGIYLSGYLDIFHLPIFFDAGFTDINHHNRNGVIVIQVVGLGLCSFRCDENGGIMSLSPQSLGWLEGRGCLDEQLTSSPTKPVNESATGWHMLALWLHHERPSRLSFDILKGVFQSRRSDKCDCYCSSNGCLPLSIYMKAFFHLCKGEDIYHGFNLHPDSECWELIPAGMEMELLRFITFEALEMTHTCCRWGTADVPCPRHLTLTLVKYPGDFDGIRQEEEELAERLEALLEEFETELRESKATLRDFLWGYWLDRMMDECIPVDGDSEESCTSMGITLTKKYATPFHLRLLLRGSLDRASEERSSSCGGFAGCLRH